MAAVLSPLLAGDRFAEMADLDSTCETLEIRLNRDDSLSPDDSINLQSELTNLHYRLESEKKLEVQKARLTGLLNVLIGMNPSKLLSAVPPTRASSKKSWWLK